MKKHGLFLLLITVVGLLISSCEKGNSFQTTPSGLRYILHTTTKGYKPKAGDIITMRMRYVSQPDSVLFDSWAKDGRSVRVPLHEPSFKGGIEEGFAMLSKGDSATFEVPADSIFEKIFGGKTPPFVTKGSMMTFTVRMEDIEKKEDYEQKLNAQMEQMRQAEVTSLAQYVQQNKITATPTTDGLYYISTKEGKGIAADSGKVVKVNYVGHFLNGQVFDSSSAATPFEFVLGAGEVVKGWDKGIEMMKEGGKAQIILPSQLAYGARGAQHPQTGQYIIPPFTPLVFELELVSVK